MKLGVIIVTYNRLALLKECIDACLNQTYSFEKIYVVNNASSDGTKDYLDSLKNKKIEVCNLSENIGGSGGFYEGVKYFKESNLDYILLIDDDAIIDNNYNEEIVKIINIDNSLSGYSGTVKTNDMIQYDHRKHLKNDKSFVTMNSLKEDYESEYFDYDLSTFCGLYIPIKLINKIGLPKKEFFIWFDDTEYSLRLRKYGKIRNINTTSLNHKTNVSTNTAFTWKSYYGLRNQIYILKKYYSKFELFKFTLSMHIRIIGGKILGFLRNNKYYYNVSNLYKDALNDGLNNKLGKHEKYIPGFTLK